MNEVKEFILRQIVLQYGEIPEGVLVVGVDPDGEVRFAYPEWDFFLQDEDIKELEEMLPKPLYTYPVCSPTRDLLLEATLVFEI